MERDDSQLVEHLGWVQRLALSLAKNRDAADDLTQDVARVWLEKRPALASGPRSWLAAVTRRLAVDRARSETARKAREHSAARPEGESYEVVERGARQRRVVEAVLQLAEPYRSTILYRYLDDLPTHAVAQRMGVPEATVRKRIERGLALLREKLDREFGAKSNAWAFGLLEPGLRAALLKGVGIMSVKWIVAAGVALLVAGGVWYARSGAIPERPLEVGGKGVVVPPEVAAEREKPAPIESARLESPAEAPRAVEGTAPSPAGLAPNVHGFLFVDDEHRAPAGAEITVEGSRARGSIDAADGTWWLEDLDGQAARLWITSPSTVPALIPVPDDLCTKGGVFDLHLSTGRTLALTFLDRETKAPVPNLDFEFSSSVETERSAGRVSTRSKESLHRTDAQGKATLTGGAPFGYVSVTIDLSVRERNVVMKGGGTVRMGTRRTPDWSSWFKEQQPERVEQTILVSVPLGEACASGQVPAWAGGAADVRVMARDTTNETPQGRGMPFLLTPDAQGRFDLCANAPATLSVWLERADNGEHISGESQLVFKLPGAQDPITFTELQGKKVTLRFIHVPEQGEIQALSPNSVTLRCNGADFTHEFALTGDEPLQLMLRSAAGAREKSGWRRTIDVGDSHEITVDLGGGERSVHLESAELDPLTGDGAITLMRVENGEARLGESVTVMCHAGAGTSAVHLPNGRWLYRYDSGSQVAVWGVVEVTGAAHAGDELVLRPRLRLAPVAEIQPVIRFDEIEGVSLAKLPDKFRMAGAKGLSGDVALPLDAKWSPFDVNSIKLPGK